MPLLRDGQVIRDTYEVERYLAEGAFGEVYRVRHRFLGRLAMKVIKMPGMTREDAQEMLSEAALLSRIGHPNIIRVFDADVTDTEFGQCAFFTMEYVAAGSLLSYWRSFGGKHVPIPEAVDLIRQVCRGLSVAHSEDPPIVHRDLKLDNVLVGYDNNGLRARIGDFGLAKRANPLTLMVTARGAMAFKAPETFKDAKSDSCAGDVWAVGCMLYLLLTDRLPWRKSSDNRLPDKPVIDSTWIPPSQHRAGIDAELDRITAKTLALAPEDRYPDARPLLADLERWKPGATPAAQPETATATKSALGTQTPGDSAQARERARQALDLARQVGRLGEAADLMEEAFKDCPALRDQYDYRVKLWRRGLTM